MNRKSLLLVVLVLLFTVAGCDDDGVPTVTGGGDSTFPHKVGSLWTYDYAEISINGDDTTIFVTDTVDVVVIRDTILDNGDSATIWVFRYGTQAVTDTQLVVMAGDSVKLEWDTLSTPTAIIWPIDTSLTWVGGVGHTDTTTVSGPLSVSVEGGSFSNTYWIQRKWTDPEEEEKVEETNIWLVPNVGIVWYQFYREQEVLQPSERYQRWVLLSYDLP